MSKQLTISATLSVIAMAAFALHAAPPAAHRIAASAPTATAGELKASLPGS